MATRKPLTIWLGAHHELADVLRAQGHEVLDTKSVGSSCCLGFHKYDLFIGPDCWHLPDNAPNPDEHVARAVAWTQERKYGKPSRVKK